MSKPDIKSAFRNVPVHPSAWELLGMKWEGLYFFDMVLPFGLRSAPPSFLMNSLLRLYGSFKLNFIFPRLLIY